MSKKLQNLEGLRGYMSLWVFITHAFPICVFPFEKERGIGKILVNGDYAVGVFIIISGFVTGILLNKNEDYLTYIKRRFFRLFPIYLIVLIFSTLLIDWSIDVFNNIPWHHSKNSVDINFLNDAKKNLFIHFTSHSILLHGLLPESWINASYTLVGPAWSLTLEWQFYLLAPVFFYAYTSKSSTVKIITIIAVIVSVCLSRVFMPQRTFLPNHIFYFLIGFISYELFRKDLNSLFHLFMCAIVLLNLNFNPIISIIYVIWWLTMYLQMSNSKLNYIFQNKIALFLGKISYSLYCVHMLILIFCSWFVLHFLNFDSKLMYGILVFVLSSLLTIIVSAITFKYIEEKFITLGKK